jgi:hypothetical protein
MFMKDRLLITLEVTIHRMFNWISIVEVWVFMSKDNVILGDNKTNVCLI